MCAVKSTRSSFCNLQQDTLAERSKALAQGASPQGRGFEPHRCHLIIVNMCVLLWHRMWTHTARFYLVSLFVVICFCAVKIRLSQFFLVFFALHFLHAIWPPFLLQLALPHPDPLHQTNPVHPYSPPLLLRPPFPAPTPQGFEPMTSRPSGPTPDHRATAPDAIFGSRRLSVLYFFAWG